MSDTYSSAVLADSPVAYWRMDDASGITCVDIVAAANGTYAPNSGGAWTAGRLGTRGIIAGAKAALFNAASSLVTVSSVPLNATDNLSFECWVRQDVSQAPGTCPLYIGAIASNGYGFRVISTGYGIRIAATNLTSAAVTPTDWTHLVGVRRATAWYIYINGAETDLSATNAPSAPTPNTYIGAQDASAGNKFLGQITEVALYNTALSAARISAHYAAGTLTTIAGGIIRTGMDGGI